ncbi:acyl-CoA thioester hydrolase [Candidatus Electrothrix marina]|uniref:Acyl-CoA thioester hydrolase n=1 Tax=Candidatus Electrothrix marina TaxID=1859130 RepID=A0A3S4TAL5_9BACT|nr:acyl-CoA thioester hydrolase [Candidatus Electrothrix marina]RWX52514.1 acyl-CoA thioester hydrolase [Candidatus Electrothrix marina]
MESGVADLHMKMTEPIFRVQYRVIYGDTDSGGVVYNANYLRFAEIGRTELMRKWAVPYSEMERQGIILPVTESYLRYKAPARYDDLLTIATSLAEVKFVSLRFHFTITRWEEERKREQLLVKGFTNHACINRQGKLTPFPDNIREAIQGVWQYEAT